MRLLLTKSKVLLLVLMLTVAKVHASEEEVRLFDDDEEEEEEEEEGEGEEGEEGEEEEEEEEEDLIKISDIVVGVGYNIFVRCLICVGALARRFFFQFKPRGAGGRLSYVLAANIRSKTASNQRLRNKSSRFELVAFRR